MDSQSYIQQPSPKLDPRGLEDDRKGDKESKYGTMYKSLKAKLFLAPILLFFVFYLIWLFRAYYDVAYMDQMQILAGNINNMYNHDASLQDYYYRSPFLLFFSTILVFINSKLFSYNTFYENIVSGVILLGIAFYYIKSNIDHFSNRHKWLFAGMAAFIVFSLTKWEMSLWGGGFSHYMVVLFGFVCIDMAHKYYLSKQGNRFVDKYFVVLYTVLSVVSILETTSYFLPFQVSLILLLIINYKLFKDRINLKRWRTVLVTTAGLIFFSLLINYLAEYYSAHHPYEAYGKVNMSSYIGASVNKIINDPLFVVKFFLSANAGNLMDKDSYPQSSFAFSIMPFIGLLVLLFYSYAVYLFIKKRKAEGTVAINLVIYTVVLYGTITMGRLQFEDVYYGAASRYSAASFAGILGMATFFLLLSQGRKISNLKQVLYYAPLALTLICTLIVYKNQWQIAPYRKEYYIKMADNLKANKNLETLMGYNNDITGNAREMMIRNKLNVFKPKQRLSSYTLSSNGPDKFLAGFYEVENASEVPFRWTNGEGVAELPNLFTTSDTVKAQLRCYMPLPDTPVVVLNDNLLPFSTTAIEGGYEYRFAFQEQKVLFKAQIKNKSFKPQEIDKNSPDNRTLGLIFHSLTLHQNK